jgi:acyl-CoA synthetase (AMP-forming)/AMP-acid ligase II
MIGVRKDQLLKTVEWYQSIYQVSSRSLLGSPLPCTYNFTFVAGILLTSQVGATFYTTENIEEFIQIISSRSIRSDRCVLLTNPVVLESISGLRKRFGSQVLIDSGGAPLSRSAVHWFREHIGDLREGYGLTETCSLTHFDTEGSDDSLGTVGCGMDGVETFIRKKHGKPLIIIRSPQIGVVFYLRLICRCIPESSKSVRATTIPTPMRTSSAGSGR